MLHGKDRMTLNTRTQYKDPRVKRLLPLLLHIAVSRTSWVHAHAWPCLPTQVPPMHTKHMHTCLVRIHPCTCTTCTCTTKCSTMHPHLCLQRHRPHHHQPPRTAHHHPATPGCIHGAWHAARRRHVGIVMQPWQRLHTPACGGGGVGRPSGCMHEGWAYLVRAEMCWQCVQCMSVHIPMQDVICEQLNAGG